MISKRFCGCTDANGMKSLPFTKKIVGYAYTCLPFRASLPNQFMSPETEAKSVAYTSVCVLSTASQSIGISALLVLGAAGGALAYRQSQIRAAEIAAAHAAERAENEAKMTKLMDELKSQTDAIAALQMELLHAQNDADRKAAEAKLLEMQEQQNRTRTRIAAARSNAGGAPGPAAPKPACTCQAGDPLCSCL